MLAGRLRPWPSPKMLAAGRLRSPTGLLFSSGLSSSALTRFVLVANHARPRPLPRSRWLSSSSSAFPPPTIDPPAFSLAGRLVLVTGGARGLGLVMGQAIVASGADLAIVDLNKDEAQRQAEIMVNAFKAQHPNQRLPRVTGHYADVSSETSIDTCVSEVVAAHSTSSAAPAVIDGLVTSAGFTENIPAAQYPPERLRALWAVNVDGTYMFATAVARQLFAAARASSPEALPRLQSASMVLVGSMSGAIVNVPQPQAPYNISKAAVRHMAASLAVEWAPAGIRVNCLAPGYMATAMTDSILDAQPALRERWTSGVPQGRLGTPSDLAGPVVFLLSNAAKYITGAELRVDGGYTIV